MASRKQGVDRVCFCGSGKAYDDCCARYIEGAEVPATAEQLMRSRYSAFAVGAEAYLLATWHPDSRPSRVRLDPQQKWIGLTIRSTEAGGAEDAEGRIEFVARFKVAGKGHRLHENSRFQKIDGRWYYLDGDHL